MSSANSQSIARDSVSSSSEEGSGLSGRGLRAFYLRQGPDGGGNTGGGYGGGGGGGGGGSGGGVRSAPPPPQQDKAPPQQQIALHHPAPNPMMAYHAGRPPAQPPPGGASLPPNYIYHTAPLRPQPRQIPTPRPTTTLIPYFDNSSVSPLCAPFYSTVPIPMMYAGGGTPEGARAPPPGPFTTWQANPSGQPQVIMTQPPTPQPNPQQQPQPQPTSYVQSQFATFIPRMTQSYTTSGGGSGSGGGPGTIVQTAPQAAVIVDQRQMQVGSAQQGNKAKVTRKNRIPIIDPDTGREIILEADSAAVPGGASGGSGATQERTGGSGHPHTQLQPATTNQVGSGNAHIAANFAEQVLVAMNESTNRVPRDTEEPQVNGPGSSTLMGSVVGTGATPVEEPAPPPVVNSQTVSTPNKRPPGHTPVVSAQAEGLTYDIQSIRNNVNKVDIRSSESSPARSKVTIIPILHPLSSEASPLLHHQTMASTVQQHSLQLSQPLHHHAPPVQPPVHHPVQIPPSMLPVQPVMQPQPVVAQPPPEIQPPVQTQPQPKPLIEQQPKQQRRPKEEKKPQPVKSPVQVEEKEDRPRSRTPSSMSQTPPMSKEEEIVQAAPPPVSTVAKSMAPPTTVEKLVPHLHQEKITSQLEKSQPPREEKQHQKDIKPVEKLVERVSAPEPIPEKQTLTDVPKPDSEKTDIPSVPKPSEKRSSPAPTAVVAPPAPAKAKTPFAEGFSLAHIKVSAKAAAQQVAAVTASAAQTQAAQQSETSDSADTPHSQGKSMGRKNKGKQKPREMNQKGVEKEGTDMDAFIDTNARVPTDNNNRLTNDLTSPRLSAAQTKTDDVKQDAVAPVNQRNTDMEDIEDSGDDMVAAKNQENNKKNNLDDGELSDSSSQVIASQPSLKYRYKDDQWSPVNPQGKKVYDRDFLMKLREDPQSSKKPDITTDVEIFVKDSQGGGGGAGAMRRNPSSHGPYSGFGGSASMRNSSNNGLFPDFIRTSLSQRMPVKRNSQGSGGNRMSGGQRSLKPMYSLTLRDEYKLDLSENAWKPSKLNRAQEIKSKEERDAEELYKKVRGILNKLTPQKFDTLVLQFQNLPISSLERLQGVIRLVFEKAVDEPAFSVSYANLCKVLAKLQVTENSMGGISVTQNQDPNAQGKQPVLFRKLLITRCQQEFETNKKLEMDFEKRQQDINETPDQDKRKEMQILFNEEERKIRMKSVGLVTFIGELFKLKMLTANIMHGCIKQLLGKIDEESLECLCKLLTTIGREFEEQITHSKSNQGGGIAEFNEYFQQMMKLSRKHEGSRVSSRVRFMLQDVIELRQSNWVPRRDENKPKTMAQIQEEVEMESVKAASQASQMHRVTQSANQDRGQQRRNPRSNQSEDGWTNVTNNKYSRNTNFAAEATKIQGLRVSMASQEFDRGNRGETVLGSMVSYGKWGAGAGTSTRTQTSGSGFTDMNSFSALLDSGDRKASQAAGRLSSLSKMSDSKEADKKDALLTTAAFMRQQSSSEKDIKDRDTSRGRIVASGGSPLPLSTPPGMRKPPSLIEQPSQRPLESQRRTQSDTGRSADSSRESTPGPTPPQVDKSRVEVPQPIEPVDEEKLKQSATTIIEEYISNLNIQESVECYKEQFVDAGALFVSTCLNYIVDQMKREKRQRTAQLLGELMKHQQFPPSLLVSELQVFFEMIYDLAVDIPHIWQYLGEIFGDIMCVGVTDFRNLKDASSLIPDSACDINKLESTLREVMKILLLDKVPLTVKKIWDSSNVQIKDFISDKATADKFLVDFAFLEGKEVVANDSNLPFNKVEEKLLSFLKLNENFDEMCGWLTVHLGKRTEDPKFIRHLTEAVIKSSVSMDDATKSYKFDKNILNKNLKFIKRYVDNNEELELWCLYSVQYVVVNTLECPSGMLVEIFKELYESLVISPEGFYKWRQDDDKCAGWQNEGRGVAIASSKSFFQAMEQEINEDQEDEPS